MKQNQIGNSRAQKNDPTRIQGHIPNKDISECGLYTLTDEVTGKLYVGSTDNLHRRKIQHLSYLSRYVHPNAALQKSFDTTGKLRLDFYPVPPETPEGVKLDVARFMEKTALDTCPKERLMNVSMDPSKPMVGISPTVEIRSKISATLTGVPKTPEHRERISEALKGIAHTNERKEHVSESGTKYRVEVDGIVYPNATKAAVALGIGNKSEVRRRCLSEKHPNYRRVERTNQT